MEEDDGKLVKTNEQIGTINEQEKLFEMVIDPKTSIRFWIVEWHKQQ